MIDIVQSLAGTLDTELAKARSNLRSVDTNIKKLFGKDAFELSNFNSNRSRRNFPNQTDYQQSDNYDSNSFGHSRSLRKRNDYDRDRDRDRHDDEPGEKRRRVDSGRAPPVVVSKLRPRYEAEDEDYDYGHSGSGSGRRLQSRVVSSSKEKSREDVLAEQSKDRRGRDRNRRMFGALLGTLHRFKQEETKLKTKEEKRAQIEAKLDEAAKREKEEVKKEKQQLIRDRKLQITEIKRLEIKRRRIAELEQWEAKTRYLTNFIRTEAKPHIFYLPKILNPITECRLDESKQFVTEMIASKRKLVLNDLEDFEQRSRRYWESRVDGGESSKKDEVDPMDEDMEFELKEIMKNDEDLEDGEDFTVTVFENKKESSQTIEEETGEEPSEGRQKDDEEEEDQVVEGEREILVEASVTKVEATDVVVTEEQEEEEDDEEDDDDEEQEQHTIPDNEDGEDMNEDSKENLTN